MNENLENAYLLDAIFNDHDVQNLETNKQVMEAQYELVKEKIEMDADAANKFYESLTLPKWKHITPE